MKNINVPYLNFTPIPSSLKQNFRINLQNYSLFVLINPNPNCLELTSQSLDGISINDFNYYLVTYSKTKGKTKPHSKLNPKN